VAKAGQHYETFTLYSCKGIELDGAQSFTREVGAARMDEQ
jgi:hypothetical protein